MKIQEHERILCRRCAKGKHIIPERKTEPKEAPSEPKEKKVPKMKRLLISIWGVEDERDKSGLTRRVNWKWFWMDMLTISLAFIVSLVAVLFIILYLVRN